ncbi:MAG: hypothetical protein FKY71_10555 [Spiribacter salinus]|uniref:Uncharacterized protein n=1 Tax=Spiribacter salinus TaxID=1335746 RepID=A0A540VQM5_9GAMM|nr:MAG: hypothetical protein FKY71_10555 [Spiribacter salinus]
MVQKLSDSAIRMRAGESARQFADVGAATNKVIEAVDKLQRAVRTADDKIVAAGNDSRLSSKGIAEKVDAAVAEFEAEANRLADYPTKVVDKRKAELQGAGDAWKEPTAGASDVRRRISEANDPAAEALKHRNDTEVMGAILAAPPMASGLSAADHNRLKQAATSQDRETMAELDKIERAEGLLSSAINGARALVRSQAERAKASAKPGEAAQRQYATARKGF